MLSVRDSFTKNCHQLFVKLMGVISTHQRSNYCEDVLYCAPRYGRQAQIITKLNNVCVRTSNLSVRLGCLLPQSFRLDGTGEKKRIDKN